MSTLLVAFKTTLFDMEKDMEIRGHVCLALINYITKHLLIAIAPSYMFVKG